MKHIVRMVVMAVAFVCFFSASPLFAQRVKEPDEKPAPTDESLLCRLACWGGIGGLFGCDCGGGANPTDCQRHCQEALYMKMQQCRGLDVEDPEYAACIEDANQMNEECLQACG